MAQNESEETQPGNKKKRRVIVIRGHSDSAKTTPRQKLIRRVIILLGEITACGILTLALLSTLFVFVVRPILEGFSTDACSSDMQLLDRLGRFDLPRSATNLESSCWGIQGWVASARFEMDSDDLDAFIASTLLEEPLAQGEPPDGYGNIYGFEFNGESYLYGTFEMPELEQRILIDVSDPETYVVYVTTLGG